jgi:hypothetical protein
VGVALLTSQGFRRTIVVGLAGLAVVTGLAALASELLDLALDKSIAASALALLTGQMALSRHGRAPAAMTFWIGVGTLPALAVGGALAELDEQLLEIPSHALGLAWRLVGWVTLQNLPAVLASS